MNDLDYTKKQRKESGPSNLERGHYIPMKNITFRAEKSLIEQAQRVARAQHRTLNVAFREWREGYVARAGSGAAVDDLMRQLQHVRSSGPYSRDEMVER